MSTLRKAIGMGAKVSIAEGDGIVVALSHTEPLHFDIRLLETGVTVARRPAPDVKLIDSYPVDDLAIPTEFRDWIKARHTIRTRKPSERTNSLTAKPAKAHKYFMFIRAFITRRADEREDTTSR